MGWPVWWKRFVTQFQIVQFVSSLVMFAITMTYYASGADCAGTYALGFNLFFNVTLLYQFFGVLGTKPRSAQATHAKSN